MGLQPSTYLYSDLLLNVKRTFGDESGVQLDESDILRWANEGLLAIIARNRVLRTKSSQSTVIGQADYDFASLSIYEISSLELNGQFLPNVPFEDAELRIMALDPQRTQTGQPQYWYVWDDVFTLWPVPDAAYSLTLRYVRTPAKLTGMTTDVIDIPDKYYSALTDYILSKCYEMDEDWQAQQAKVQAFEAAVNMHGQEERSAQEMSYPVIREVEYF